MPPKGSLLYVSIDLGEPTLAQLTLSAKALNDLVWFATALTYSLDARQERQDIRLVRMSMASPWISILENLAEHSSPVGYTITALYALQRLLNAVMKWQNHRLDITERELQLEALRKQIRDAVVPELAVARLDDKREKQFVTLEELVGGTLATIDRPLSDLTSGLSAPVAPTEASTTQKQELTKPPANSVAERNKSMSPMERGIQDVPGLGRVLAAEFISPDDHRLRAKPDPL